MRPVITTAELAGLLEGRPTWVPAAADSGAAVGELPAVLDVRWRLGGPAGVDSYHAGHLPGAVFLDVDTQLSGPPGAGGRHPLPDPAALERTLRAAGVRATQPVVAYDDGDSSVAARAWWLLRWAGHRSVAVLDGGFAAWLAEGRPVTTEPAQPVPGDIEVRPGHLPVLDPGAAATRARDGVLLDARAPSRYTGGTEPVDPRAGHIPGAVNAPFSAHIGPDGRWRTPAELDRHFAALGVTPDTPVGAYCGSGVTAASVVLALEVAGYPEPAALFAGSWSEWSADPTRPAVTGSQPG